MESNGGMILTGENQRTLRRTCSSATLSTTNPTWTDLGINLGLHGEWLATNYLSHDMVYVALINKAYHTKTQMTKYISSISYMF
jgi:hypothetical protein